MINFGSDQTGEAGEERPDRHNKPVTPPAASQGTGGDNLLRSLLESGQLRVDQKLVIELDDGRVASLVRVDLEPGVDEPRHTHPGLEILYGLAGSGYVELDRREQQPIMPDTAVRVDSGQVKALRNASGTERLSVLAVMILEKGRPPLTTVE